MGVVWQLYRRLTTSKLLFCTCRSNGTYTPSVIAVKTQNTSVLSVATSLGDDWLTSIALIGVVVMSTLDLQVVGCELSRHHVAALLRAPWSCILSVRDP